MVNKIDSNLTGLRYAAEVVGQVGTLPATPVWHGLEPNSYSDFGGKTKVTPRNPITSSRMVRKGVLTDLDASANFAVDLTQSSIKDLLQGFMFAAWQSKALYTATAVDAALGFVVTGATQSVGDLVFASGFGVAANNGLHVLTAASGTDLGFVGPVAEASVTASVKHVGFQFASGDAAAVLVNGVATLTTAAKDLTTLGLVPGEWVFVGGDAAGTAFATATQNNGFARVASVAAHAVTFDKTAGAWAADAGAGQTIQLFFGDRLFNQIDPAQQVMQSYQLERTLGAAGAEYLLGAVPNQLTITMKQASKVSVDLTFVATDTSFVDFNLGQAVKSGTRPSMTAQKAFNTSSNFSRLRVAEADNTGLANFLMDATLMISNNATPVKALSKLGAIDVSVGDLQVSGKMTAYFTSVAACEAVKANADCTLDFALVQGNAGMLYDVPLVSLADGRMNVAKDKPIELPLDHEGAQHPTLNYIMMIASFDYLPTLAGNS